MWQADPSNTTENSTLYLGAEIGVYKKAMTATSWELFSDDLPNTTAMELEVIYGSNTLRAATWGRGLWESTLSGRENYPSILTTEITNQLDKLSSEYFGKLFVK